MSKVNEYKGKDITIYFDGSKCIHSRNCVLSLPNVFRANVEDPWIFPDDADAEDIAALAHTCPSGAIAYQRHNCGKQEVAPQVNTIRIQENGPLAVHAELHLAANQPAIFRATLCRCGASKNKPFCDGSHKDANFVATGEPATIPSAPLEKRDGPLDVTPLPDGPLAIKGNVEICTGTGRTVLRTQQTALCRCGASKNKPFCDGSHTFAGFKAD